MDNTFEVLMNAIKENKGGFSTADFSLLGFNSPPSDNEIETAIQNKTA